MATDFAVVKELEWEYVERPAMTYTAFWADGDVAYYVDQTFGSDSYFFRTVRWPDETIYDGDDLPSAQAAAQADFEQRGRSMLSQDYLDLKASHHAAVGALRAVRNCFEVEYHDDGHIACLGHDNDGLRSVVRLLDGALTTPAAPAAADDGWIAWWGGECSVDGDTVVDVKFRDGAVLLRLTAGFWSWAHVGHRSDIVAYRPAAGGAL